MEKGQHPPGGGGRRGTSAPARRGRTHAPAQAHHPLHDDDLGAQLLVDGEDVDEPEREHHEVEGKHRAAGLEGPGQHPGVGKSGWMAAVPREGWGFLQDAQHGHQTWVDPSCRQPCPPAPQGCPCQASGPPDLQVTPAMNRKMATMSHLFQLSST